MTDQTVRLTKSPDKTSGEGVRSGDGTQILTLSLFIVLLAFFIVLSASYGFDRNKVENAMDSVNRAFGAQIFSAMDRSPSMRESKEKSSGSGFASVQDFRAYMQDSFQGFELRMNDYGEGQLTAQLRLNKEEFLKHFKFIARKMASVYSKSGQQNVRFKLIEQTPEKIGRTRVFNLSKLAIRAGKFGVPSGILDIGFQTMDDHYFIIQFVFEEG